MTIISSSRKFVFIHLHKSGGTSIERSYEKEALWDDLIIGSTTHGEAIQRYYSQKYGISKHSSANELKKILGNDLWKDCFKVAIVREPIDYYRSFYRWSHMIVRLNAKNDERLIGEWKKLLENNIKVSGFLNWGAIKAYLLSDTFDEFIETGFKLDLFEGTYHSRLTDGNGLLLVDKLYKFQDFKTIWSDLNNILGIELKPIKVNVSPIIELKCSAHTKNLISEYHKRDLELFFGEQPS